MTGLNRVTDFGLNSASLAANTNRIDSQIPLVMSNSSLTYKLQQIRTRNNVNLFDKTKAVLGTNNTTTGAFTSGTSSWNGFTYEAYTSDFIPCNPGDTFTKSQLQVGTQVTYWDTNKAFVSGADIYTRTFTAPSTSTIAYVKVTVLQFSTDKTQSRFLVHLNDFMVVKGSTLPIDTTVSNSSPTRPVIFDTDWAYDCDDAVAARILCWAERAGLVDIVAVTTSYNTVQVVPSLDAFFTAEGRSGLTIGVNRAYAMGNYNTGVWHTNLMTNPHTYPDTPSAEDALRTYRRALVQSANNQKRLDIIVTGPLDNIQNLLQSPADDISSLTGYELVAKNVRKMWVMGGQYPSGSEANFVYQRNSNYSASYVCANFPRPITFLGWEVGNAVKTGGNLSSIYSVDQDVLTRVLYDAGYVNGRDSWDPMTMFLAVLDNYDLAGYSVVGGTNTVNSTTGANTFTTDIVVHHEYVVKMYPNDWYVSRMNPILTKIGWPTRTLGSQQLPKP